MFVVSYEMLSLLFFVCFVIGFVCIDSMHTNMAKKKPKTKKKQLIVPAWMDGCIAGSAPIVAFMVFADFLSFFFVSVLPKIEAK